MITRQIEKDTEAPRDQDLEKLEELFYNALMAAWIIGYWTGKNRVVEEIEASTPPKFTPVNAIKFILSKLALPAEVLTAVQVKIATYSSKLAILTGYDGFRRVKELFARALEQGQTKKEFLDEVGKDGVLSRTGFNKRDPWYTDVVYRTNLSTAYNAGNWDTYQEYKEDIAFYEYVAIEDDRTTPICESLAGTIRKTSDPIWSNYWPPNHFQCRSEVLAVSHSRAKILDVKETKIPSSDDLKFPKGNEDFKGNAGKDFGNVTKDQRNRAVEMQVMEKMNKRADRVEKAIKKKK